MSVSVDAAVVEVRTLARALKKPLLSDEPTIVADRSNLVLRLGAEVARVAMATSLARVGMEWLQREVEIASYLDAHGASVTRPAVDAGPFERKGLVISFWVYEPPTFDPAPSAAGAALGACHAALAAYPTERLPRWGAFDEARQVFQRACDNGAYDAAERARIDHAWSLAERILVKQISLFTPEFEEKLRALKSDEARASESRRGRPTPRSMRRRRSWRAFSKNSSPHRWPSWTGTTRTMCSER